MEKKRMKDSYTEQVQILNSASLNGYGRLFGGQLMEWIDVVAGVVARRHSGKNVTTACVDTLLFVSAAHANDTLVLQGRITYTGRTSMEVCVETYVENLDGSKRLVNRAHLIMVALDKDEQPTLVPQLLVETDQQQQDWLSGEKRHEYLKKVRKS